MAVTYIPIASTEITTPTNTVTFSSIPSTYDHLVLRVSARTTTTTTVSSFYYLCNGDTGSNYYGGFIYAENSSIGGGSQAMTTLGNFGGVMYIPGASASANVFSANEITFWNYKSSYKKTAGQFSGAPNAAGLSGASWAGMVWNNTTAISSLTLTTSSGNFDTYSTFRLYGLNNS
jgi:hypothetical protein